MLEDENDSAPKKPCGDVPDAPWTEEEESPGRKRNPKQKVIRRQRNPRRKKDHTDG